MSALFDFSSLIMILLLSICSCTYIRYYYYYYEYYRYGQCGYGDYCRIGVYPKRVPISPMLLPKRLFFF